MFTITKESGGIRVKSENAEVFYQNLEEADFYEAYNEIVSCLPFNFSPVSVEGKTYSLTASEQLYLVQSTAASILYLYTVNNEPFSREGISLSKIVVTDQVIWMLDKKFKRRKNGTEVSLVLGAHLLRRPLEDYRKTVAGRRRYYDR